MLYAKLQKLDSRSFKYTVWLLHLYDILEKSKLKAEKKISGCQRLGMEGVNYVREFWGNRGNESVLYLDWGVSELY